jgi:hypothetical protein
VAGRCDFNGKLAAKSAKIRHCIAQCRQNTTPPIINKIVYKAAIATELSCQVGRQFDPNSLRMYLTSLY